MGSVNNSNSDNHLIPSRVLIVFDATKDRSRHEFGHTIRNVRLQGEYVHSGDTITVLGVLHKVLHPMGYQMGVAPENFLGATHIRAMEEEASKKLDWYAGMLQHSVEECESQGVDIEVKITAGTPIRKVVAQEVANFKNTTWVIIDRHLRRESRHICNNIQCKIALILDNLSFHVLRPIPENKKTDFIEDRIFYSLSRPVRLPAVQDYENKLSVNYEVSTSSLESSDMSKSSLFSSFTSILFSQADVASNSKQEGSGTNTKENNKYYFPPNMITKQQRKASQPRFFDVPILCISCELKTEIDSKRFSYSEIQLATNDFATDNLLGEGGYGFVYKGELKNGQQIAAKVRKEKSTQGFSEFHSEVYILNFAHHRNIVMLLGYCCKENLNILVYEYICNRTLDWHLFDNPDHVLEWHRRHAIAVGTAKGLRFLHDECRGGPIIHRDIRPSNILLTHDFVPMLGDFGLAKCITSDEDMHTRILGTLGYLAPEYVENGMVSVRTDVYAFGIVLIQLISGRKVVDSARENTYTSLRQWALPLLESLALHKLADARLGDFNTFELYHMARIAYLCIQTDPEKRPSMAEVLRLLEGESDHFQHLTEQFKPHYSKFSASLRH